MPRGRPKKVLTDDQNNPLPPTPPTPETVVEAARIRDAAEPKEERVAAHAVHDDSPARGAVPEDALLKRLAELERRDAENQKKLQMLEAVADKGRVFSWESRQNKQGHGQKVRISVIDGNFLVGWRTVRDELVNDPRTGRTIGELQQYELKLLSSDGTETTREVNGYLNFSNLRYERQVECPILSRSESYDGSTTFRIGLPDGREVSLASNFIN